jgi:periplasmic divalent cation tolerance protein
MSENLLVFCTCPDQATAHALAEMLVRDRLAACVNITGEITSVYAWKNQIEHAAECLLLIKTCSARYQDLENTLRTHHPYELPEIIAIPIQQGFANYLQWVDQCTNVSR